MWYHTAITFVTGRGELARQLMVAEWPLMKRRAEARRGRALLAAGLLSASVYLALAGRLSWWRYGQTLGSWAQLLGEEPAAWGVCLGGIGVLAALYVWGLRCVRTGDARRRTIWAFAFVSAAALVWLMPITSDLFAYLSHAHMVTDLGANPLWQAPRDFRDPILLAYRTVYAARPAMYGPVWILLSAPGTVGLYDIPVGLFYLKGLVAVAYLGSAWLVERILLELRPEVALEGLYLFAWSPFVLFMAVGDGHNDIAMMALVLLALWLLRRERWMLAFGVLALSVWTKYVSLVLLPLFLIYAWRRQEEGKRWALPRPAAQGGLAMALVSLLMVVPLGGPEGLLGIAQRLLHPLNWRSGASGMPTVILGAGLSLFALVYAVLVMRFWRGSGTFQQLTNAGFLAMLLAFFLGAARSQPWHLLWGAALAGLSNYRWAQPVIVGLSILMLAVQVGVEWAVPTGLSR